MWKPIACALLTLSSATAATIIGVTEYPGSGRGGTTGGSTLAVQFSFALSEAYTNVTISADLDRHASGQYTFTGSTHAWTPVLYLHHISAGSHFLTLSTDGFSFGIGSLPGFSHSARHRHGTRSLVSPQILHVE